MHSCFIISLKQAMGYVASLSNNTNSHFIWPFKQASVANTTLGIFSVTMANAHTVHRIIMSLKLS